FLTLRTPPASTPFPYTTLFRSSGVARRGVERQRVQFGSRHLRQLAIDRLPGRWAQPGVIERRLHAGLERSNQQDAEYGNRQKSGDRKSTRLNSSHVKISYAVFC